MALTIGDYHLWTTLDKSLIPERPALLELGQANWYGDVPLEKLDGLVSKVEISAACQSQMFPFLIARLFYDAVFRPRRTVVIDPHGTSEALRWDLNEPHSLGERFGVVINTGTTEHVFDQAQVFKSIHEWTAPGGLILHQVPVSGWPDHGFYTYQPGFFRDLAAANGYDTLRGLLVRLATKDRVEWVQECGLSFIVPAGDWLLYVLFRKGQDQPFVKPWQGRYAQAKEKA